MPPRTNPSKLNKLQARTLAILQQIARTMGDGDTPPMAPIRVPTGIPAHGNHFHIGDAVVFARDATGLGNPAVFTALERKGLVTETDAEGTTLTEAGLGYETGMAGQVLHRADH